MADLLSCPFCGGEAREFTGEDAAPNRWTVECDCCGAHVGSDTRHRARAKWNRRAERTCHDTRARKVFFACSECGEIYRKDYMRLWHHKPWSYCPNCGARIKEDA